MIIDKHARRKVKAMMKPWRERGYHPDTLRQIERAMVSEFQQIYLQHFKRCPRCGSRV